MSPSYAPTQENPGRILVVDDLPGNLKVLSMELKHHPFQLTLASTADADLRARRNLHANGKAVANGATSVNVGYISNPTVMKALEDNGYKAENNTTTGFGGGSWGTISW